MRLFCLLILLLVPGLVVSAEPLDVKNPDIMFSLVEVQEEIDYISSVVMGCVDSGREHSDCMCSNKAMFSRFTQKVGKLFVKHPILEGHDLVAFKDPDGVQVTQSLMGIRKQAEMQLDCSE